MGSDAADTELNFILDPNYDSQLILEMMETGGRLPDLPDGLTESLKSTNEEIRRDNLRAFVDQQYTRLSAFTARTLEWYQLSWDLINDKFFHRVVEITQYPWQHNRYECVVSLFHPGISSWGGSKIVRWWKENPFTMRRITAHELIISHYFTLIRDKFAHANLAEKDIWKLAEIAAWAMTGLDEDLRSLWPWDNSGYYTEHNYPKLVDLQLKLRSPFLERKTFEGYVEESIGLLKNH